MTDPISLNAIESSDVTDPINGTDLTGATESISASMGNVTKSESTGVTDPISVTPKGKKWELDGSSGSPSAPAAKKYVYHIASVIKI